MRRHLLLATCLLAAAGILLWIVLVEPRVREPEPPSVSQPATPATPTRPAAGSEAGPGGNLAPPAQPVPRPPPDPAGAAVAIREAFRPARMSEAELIERLHDPELALSIRCETGRILAGLGSATALAAVRAALETGPASLRAAIAEGLGHSPLPEARQLLNELVADPDEAVARGAVRGWAVAGGEVAVSLLTSLAYSGEQPESVRVEAALSLGELPDQPLAFVALTNAAWHLRDETLAPAVLEGLGRRPIVETQDFFREYLATSELPSELRTAAVEALGQAEGPGWALLVDYLADPDPEVRAGAAWALSTTLESGQAGPQLLDRLQTETDPQVRLRLYQALGNQESFDPTPVLSFVQAESRPDVRIAGYDFLAQACARNPSSALLEFFDHVAVPQLRTAALEADDRHSRLTAVIALRRARTPAATAALTDLTFLSPDPGVAEAAASLLPTTP